MAAGHRGARVRGELGNGTRAGLLVALTSLLLLLGAGAAPAEEDRLPTLAGHRFTPNALTGNPFIRTYVRNTLGIGRAVDLFIPVIEIDEGQVYGLTGDLVVAQLEFEFQQAIREWLAFRAQLRVNGRLGTGTQSLLAEGVTANLGYEFGWKFRLAEGSHTAMSGSLSVWSNKITTVDLLGFVNGVVTGSGQALVRTIPSVRVGGGLEYAWAASELVGFNFMGRTGLAESLDRSEDNQAFLQFALATDFDLLRKSRIPLGLSLAYLWDTFPEAEDVAVDFYHEAVFRISYTGTTDFLISLDISNGWYLFKDGRDNLRLVSTRINFLYYF